MRDEREVNATQVGFDVVRRSPTLLVAELAWRWSFGAAAAGVLLIASHRVRDALALSAADEAEIVSGSLIDAAQAMTRILYRAIPHLLITAAFALPAIALAWILCTSIGRRSVSRGIYVALGIDAAALPPNSWLSYVCVNCVRVILLLILVIGYLIGQLLAALVIGTIESPHVIAALLVFLFVFCVSAIVWSVCNFVASLASLQVARFGMPALDALAEAVVFTRRNVGVLAAVASANATMRTAWAFVITIVATLAAMTGRVIGAAAATFLVVLITAVYFVVSDYLLLARTASYAAVVEQDFARASHEGRAEWTDESRLYTSPPDLRS